MTCLRRTLITLIVVGLAARSAEAQAPPPPPPPGGTGGSIQVSAVSITPVDLPMGSEFKLDCNHDPVADPTYQWESSCDGGISWDHTPDEYANKILDYKWTVPAEVLFKITVTAGNSTGSATILVKFHEPNGADVVIGPLAGRLPKKGSAPRLQIQVVRVKLKWNNIPLGPHAHLCYKERLSVTYLPQYRKIFKAFNFNGQGFNVDYWPINCVPPPYKAYGDTNDVDQVTMKWDSPYLYDRNWWPLSYREMMDASNIPAGTVVANRRHQYFFDGSKCDGVNWGPTIVTCEFEFRIEEIKDKNGNPFPLPGTNPQRNARVAKWYLTSTSVTTN